MIDDYDYFLRSIFDKKRISSLPGRKARANIENHLICRPTQITVPRPDSQIMENFIELKKASGHSARTIFRQRIKARDHSYSSPTSTSPVFLHESDEPGRALLWLNSSGSTRFRNHWVLL